MPNTISTPPRSSAWCASAGSRRCWIGSANEGLALLSDQGVVDADTLRQRLTSAMTTLSASNATLQQRERDLTQARAAAEEAAAEIEALQAASEERDVLRARLL